MGSDLLKSNLLYIRADADGKIGAGHIMRCIALAQGWRDRGGEVTFISRCESDAIIELIIQEGFQFIPIESPHPHPSDQEETLSLLFKFCNLKSEIRNWLVLDGYHFTPEYQKLIRESGFRLLVIDDMNHLPHYHADIILNQNIHALKLTYHCDEDTLLLLGTEYVLLRREFFEYRNFRRYIPDRARNILVTFGGADFDNVTLKVVEALKLLKNSEIEVKIVIGPANPHKSILSQTLSSVFFGVNLLINPSNMPELMAWSDLAISAAGSTYWEIAFMGLPCCLIILAVNQIQVANYLKEQDKALTVGWFHELSTETLARSIDALIKDKPRRLWMKQVTAGMIDGGGVHRLIDKMLREKRLEEYNVRYES